MGLYQNILLAVDLHPSCDELIIQRAVDIAKVYKAKLTVIHAVEPLNVNVYGPVVVYLGDIENKIFKDAQVQLSHLGKKYNIPSAQQVIEKGGAKFVILEQAKKLNADLIIIGSHGHHGIALLLGSTANSVLHQAPCDVLVIRVKKRITD